MNNNFKHHLFDADFFIEGQLAQWPLAQANYKALSRVEQRQIDVGTYSIKVQYNPMMGNYYVKTDYVCTMPNGVVITPNYLTRTFHSVIAKSDLPQIRLHDLRHSVASNLLNKGFSVVQVQEWLGHSSASTTLNFYAHIDKTSKINIADALDSMVSIL